ASVAMLGAAHAQPVTTPVMPAMPTAAEAQALAAQGVRPGDDVMTCEQIGMEMQPYAQAMIPAAAALGQSAQEAQAMAERQKAGAMTGMGMSMAAGIASSFLPGGGMIAQMQMQAQVAQMQRNAAEAKPLQDKMMAQGADLANTMAPMQQEPRFQR